MTDARVLLAFAALLVMALFYVRVGVKSALAPLCAVGTVSLGLSLFGVLGLLRLGGWLLYAFAAFAAGLLIWEAVAKRRRPPAPGFGFWFFAAGGLVFILLLWAKQPLFTGWDEFSLWGTAGKLMKLNDELYTTAPSGWTWPTSQKPAYIVPGYFFQFFGAEFAEWQTYAACDIFQLAMMATVFAGLEGAPNSPAVDGTRSRDAGLARNARQSWVVAVPLALVLLLLPYVFQHYQTAQSVSPAWLDTLGDIPLGLCFAAALACGLGAGAGTPARAETPNTADARRSSNAAALAAPSANRSPKATVAALLPAAMALALTTLTKDTGLALALVAAVILAVDWLIRTRGGPKKQRRVGFALRLAGGLCVVLVIFAAWEAYAGTLSGSSRLDSAVTTGGVGMLEMPFAFFRDLLDPSGMTAEKQALFSHVTGGMVQLFFTSRGNMLGAGVVIAGLCLGICALAALLYKNKTHRLRVGAFAVLSTLGFAAWYWLTTMTYIYIFRADQAATFESYDRYVYPYYIGWLLGALVLLCVALAHGQSRLAPLGRAAVLGFAALVLLRVALLVPAAYTVWGVNTQEYNQRREFNAKVDELKQYLDPGGRTFLVMSGDTGVGWFMFHHQLLPWQLDYSFGGGELVTRTAQPDGTTLVEEVSPDALAEYLVETGCTTVYVDFADYDFIQTYGGLFADGLAAYQNDEASLYTVAAQGGTVTLQPVYWQSLE